MYLVSKITRKENDIQVIEHGLYSELKFAKNRVERDATTYKRENELKELSGYTNGLRYYILKENDYTITWEIKEIEVEDD